MASPSKSAASNLGLSHHSSIEALRLKVGPVRRNLFGPVDHKQLQQDFQRVLHVGVEVATKRWNFDFQSDKPGPGPNIEWEELSCQEVPAFYRSCMVRPVRSGAGSKRRSSSSSEDGSLLSSDSSSGEEYFEVTAREFYRLPSGKRRQAVITDFFKVKKRRLLYHKESSRQ